MHFTRFHPDRWENNYYLVLKGNKTWSFGAIGETYKHWGNSLFYKPQTAPSPAPQPAPRWAPSRRTPRFSPWGSWCRWSTPWPGTSLHSQSFSPGEALAASRSDSIRLCRERRRTEGERSVSGAWVLLHRRRAAALHCSRLTSRFAPGWKVWVTAASSERLTFYTALSFFSPNKLTFEASAVRCDL